MSALGLYCADLLLNPFAADLSRRFGTSFATATRMVTKICEKCDKEMKLIPAGFSRAKNKPYAAFWTCDARNGGCVRLRDNDMVNRLPIPVVQREGLPVRREARRKMQFVYFQ